VKTAVPQAERRWNGWAAVPLAFHLCSTKIRVCGTPQSLATPQKSAPVPLVPPNFNIPLYLQAQNNRGHIFWQLDEIIRAAKALEEGST